MPDLIDRHLSDFHYVSRHATTVAAAPDVTYRILRTADLGESVATRALLLARGIRSRRRDIDSFVGRGFVLLEDVAPVELVLGLVARPWTVRGSIKRLDTDEFGAFGEPGYVKVAWNFRVQAISSAHTSIHTETRIYGTDTTARKRFGAYWTVVAPFSGLVRREMLRIVRTHAEAA